MIIRDYGNKDCFCHGHSTGAIRTGIEKKGRTFTKTRLTLYFQKILEAHREMLRRTVCRV